MSKLLPQSGDCPQRLPTHSDTLMPSKSWTTKFNLAKQINCQNAFSTFKLDLPHDNMILMYLD